MCDEWIVFSGALDLLLENQKVRHHIYKKLFYTLKITIKYCSSIQLHIISAFVIII